MTTRPNHSLPKSGRPSPSAGELRRVCDRYLQALLKGDEAEAAKAVREAVSNDWRPATIYLDVLAKAMVTIGDMWHAGGLSVAHEHQATQVTLRQASVLRQLFQPLRQTGLHAIVSAVEPDGHIFGPMIFADLLYYEGWNVDFLGAGTPPVDLAKLAAERQPDLVALSATLGSSLGLLSECVQAVRSAMREPYVVIGGLAVKAEPKKAAEIGADLIAHGPVEAVSNVGKRFDVSGSAVPLEAILRRVGERVKAKRIARGWSQQQLADASGLDRTYLSGVEHGRQNLTLGAVKKLGDALNTPVSEFVS